MVGGGGMGKGGRGVEGWRGEQSDCFCHCGLEGAAVGGVCEAVCGERLAEVEECGEDSRRGELVGGIWRGGLRRGVGRGMGGGGLVFEDNVVASERPSVVGGAEVVAVGEDAPEERVIEAVGGRRVVSVLDWRDGGFVYVRTR